MSKIFDTSRNPTSYNLISQTPKNLVEDNYYLHTLQDKVTADWRFRPNRVDVEQEKTTGENDYFPMEVVIQTVVSDSGDRVSDDIRRLVFPNIRYEVKLGTKFRFSYKFDLNEDNEKKNIWLSLNKDTVSPTAQVVIRRCNVSLGSIYTDTDGLAHYQYEPAIMTDDLSSVNIYYNEAINSPRADMFLICQFNKYTRNYYLNQRFVIGYNQVYKVTGMNNFNSLTTFDPYDVGVIILYLELDEKHPKDDFDNRIAYNEADTPAVINPSPVVDNYSFKITQPTPIPTELYNTPVEFKAYLFNGEDVVNDIGIQVQTELSGATNPENYFELVIVDDNTFTLCRKKVYNRSVLTVTCSIPADVSPTGTEFSQSFELSLRGL